MHNLNERRKGPGAYPSKDIFGEAYFKLRRGMHTCTVRRDKGVFDAVCNGHYTLDALRKHYNVESQPDAWIARCLARLQKHRLVHFDHQLHEWRPLIQRHKGACQCEYCPWEGALNELINDPQLTDTKEYRKAHGCKNWNIVGGCPRCGSPCVPTLKEM